MMRPHLLAQVCITALVILWLAHAVAQDAPVRVFLEGQRTQFEPGYIRLRVRVEPHPENRALTVAAFSDGALWTSTFEQLEGERSRLTRWVNWKNVPAGEYAVIAAIARVNGVTAQDQTSLTVLGR